MSPLLQRIAFTGAIIVLAAAAASGGVLAWRTLFPSPVQLAVSPAPPPATALPGPAEESTLAVGDPRPDFSLADLDGRMRSLSEWDGKLLVVNFWATWCPPCLEEIPGFVRLQQEYGPRGLQFLGVALDSPQNVREFMDTHQMNYPSLHGERDAIVASKLMGNRIGALPYTVAIGRDGRVLLMHQGILEQEQAARFIERNL